MARHRVLLKNIRVNSTKHLGFPPSERTNRNRDVSDQGSEMGSSVREKSSISESSAHQPKISSGEIVDRFSKMSLTPTSQADVEKKKAPKRRRKKKISLKEAEMLAKTGKNEAMPFILYEYVRRAAAVLNRSGWPNDISRKDLDELEILEYAIGVVCRCFRDDLPLCWKYEREHAESLIAGYRKVFIGDDGVKRVI